MDGCSPTLCASCAGTGSFYVEQQPKDRYFVYRFAIEELTPGMRPDWCAAKAWSDYPMGRVDGGERSGGRHAA